MNRVAAGPGDHAEVFNLSGNCVRRSVFVWVPRLAGVAMLLIGLVAFNISKERTPTAIAFVCVMAALGGTTLWMFRPNGISLTLDNSGFTYTQFFTTRRSEWTDISEISLPTFNIAGKPTEQVRIKLTGASDILIPQLLKEPRELQMLLPQRCAAAGNLPPANNTKSRLS